ncbi:MAG: GNAT family N-acetyltransferase [Flavobacteriaceae bacterium]
MFELREAISDADYTTGVALFKEYASELPIDLEFQNFDQEIENIQTQYSKPSGQLIIGYDIENKAVGCVAVRALEEGICELKRMYVRKQSRGLGLGKQLLLKSIESARQLGYERMRLDTLAEMHSAINLYKDIGFYEIEPYRFNPVETSQYFEIKL